MHRNDTQLNEFFRSEFIEKALKIYDLSKKNDYPHLTQELKRYKSRIKTLPKISGFLDIGEVFTKKINIDDNNFYAIAWRISVAKKLIEKYNPSLVKFSLEKIIGLVDHNNITKSHLDFALNNTTPILMASYPPIAASSKFVLIDGNHRVISKYKDGEKEIFGYILEPCQHLQAMVNENHRNLFKVHYNYYKIVSYIGGLIDEKELEETLYPL